MQNKTKYTKEMKLSIVPSQNKKLETIKTKGKKHLGIPLTRTGLIRIAINQFLDSIETEDDLKKILEQYQYI